MCRPVLSALACLVLSILRASAQPQNITLNDDNARLVYAPDSAWANYDVAPEKGTHIVGIHATSTLGATMTVAIYGTAIYYVAGGGASFGPASIALSFALVLQAINILPPLPVGAAALARVGLSGRELVAGPADE